MHILPLCLLIIAGLVLVWLILIDLKLRLLPDELTGGLAILGIIFQLVTQTSFMPFWWDPIAGCLVGGLFLWLVREGGNRIYGFETMGLGDVKLMAAAGIWLGTQGIVLAAGLGAFCGLLHGISLVTIGRAKGEKISLRQLTIPAGPGFIAGIIIIGVWMFW